MNRKPISTHDGFKVARWIDTLGTHISRHQRVWFWLGNLETRLLAQHLANIEIQRPIYICGLARSGTTILLEILSRHEHLVTHRYKDYPPILTPFFWNRFIERVPRRDEQANERTHQDGMLVTSDSPESFEEPIWMAFFTDSHDVAQSSVLDNETTQPEFEGFYREHIRKLLHIRGGRRYLAKGNYNLTRIEYLLKLFPDARFIIPVRDPRWHIASLMKQHALFCEGERDNPRALAHLQHVGHFEFGLDRRPINTGDRAEVEAVLKCWQAGKEIEGWARYWNYLYTHVAERLSSNAKLRDACLIVRYEDLCHSPAHILRNIFDHCRLPGADALIDGAAAKIQFPTYYRPPFDAESSTMIDHHTSAAAERFGYTSGSVPVA